MRQSRESIARSLRTQQCAWEDLHGLEVPRRRTGSTDEVTEDYSNSRRSTSEHCSPGDIRPRSEQL